MIFGGGRVLLVRHTYGPSEWELPGGSVKAREQPIETATREMREELGVEIEGWLVLGSIEAVIQHRRDTLYCFQAEVDANGVKVDPGEIAAAAWFDPAELPSDLGRYVQPIFAKRQDLE